MELEKQKGAGDHLVDMTALTDADLGEGFGGNQPTATNTVNASLIKRSVVSHRKHLVVSPIKWSVVSHIKQSLVSHIKQSLVSHIKRSVVSHMTQSVVSHIKQSVL